MVRRGLAPFALIAVLLGCGTAPTEDLQASAADPKAAQPGLFAGLGATRAKPPLRKTSLAGGVVVDGPPGYCVDPKSIGLGRSFAVLASCQVLTDGRGGSEVPLAIMTVTVGRKDAGAQVPDAQTMAAAAGSDLIDSRRNRDMTLALLESGGQEVLDGGEPRYWRGAFVLNDRPVGLALYAPQGSVLKGSSGAALLAELHDKIVAATPKNDPGVGKAAAEPLQGGGFRRLLNVKEDG